MKSLPGLFSFLLAVLFFSCNKTPDLTEDEVYTILNEIITDDSLGIHRVCWKFKDIPLTGDYKEEFTNDDIQFIRRQKILFKDQSIKPNHLKWLRRDNSFVSTDVDSLCNHGILYHVSFPLISADRQKVIIEFEEDCNCMLGGQGGKDLYIKQNGRWKRKKSFDSWIS